MMRVALDASLSRHRGGVCILSMYGVKQLGEMAQKSHGGYTHWYIVPSIVRNTNGRERATQKPKWISHYHSVWLALRIGAAGRGFLGREMPPLVADNVSSMGENPQGSHLHGALVSMDAFMLKSVETLGSPLFCWIGGSLFLCAMVIANANCCFRGLLRPLFPRPKTDECSK